MQSVQNYERGIGVSPPVKRAIVDLAEQAGLGDLVDDFLNEIEAGAAAPGSAAPEAAGHDRWHRLLAEILNSGNQAAISAVQHNLLAFSQMGGSAPKRTARQRRKA